MTLEERIVNFMTRLLILVAVLTGCDRDPSFIETAESNKRTGAKTPISDCDPKDPTCNEVNPNPCKELGVCPSAMPNKPDPSALPSTWMEVEQSFSVDETADHAMQVDTTNPYLNYDLTMKKDYRDETKTFSQITRERISEVFTQGYVGSKETENFEQNVNRKIDIAVVIDNSGSMAQEQNNLADKLSELLSAVKDNDWRIAITTTDPNDPCAKDVINKADRNAKERFKAAVTAGIDGSSTERGIFRARELLEGNRCTQGPWVRQDSTIAVLIVSDEDNCSNGNDAICQGQAWAKGDYLTNYLSSIRKLGSNARIYGLIWHPSQTQAQCSTGYNVANIYASVIDQSKGTWGSICDADYSTTLQKISKDISIILASKFTLSKTPIPQFTKVFVNNTQVTTGFTLTGNIIEFDQAPAENSKIRVEYSFDAQPILKSFKLKYAPMPQGITVAVNGQAVPATDYEVDFTNNEIFFFKEPAERANIQVAYQRNQVMLTEFEIGTDVTPSSIVVKVNGLTVTNYTFDAARGVVKFTQAPAESASLSISYRSAGTPVLAYSFNVPSIDWTLVKITDKVTGAQIPATYVNQAITFAAADFVEGRQVLVRYRNPSRDPYILVLPVTPVDQSVAATDGVIRCTTSNGLIVNGNTISMRDCGFDPSSTMIALSYKTVSGSRLKFDLIGVDLPDAESPQTWTVLVNQDIRQDYARSGNSISFRSKLPDHATVKIKVKFEKKK